jgi:hypothetical protein
LVQQCEERQAGIFLFSRLFPDDKTDYIMLMRNHPLLSEIKGGKGTKLLQSVGNVDVSGEAVTRILSCRSKSSTRKSREIQAVREKNDELAWH